MAKLIAILIALFILVSGLTSFIVVRNVSRNCNQIEALKAQIEVSIQRSIKTLPTLTYYKEHPSELQSALNQARQAAKQFAPSKCAGIF